VEIDSRIAPEAGTLLITKKRASAFPGTYLQQFLTINRIDTVIVTGVTAAGCVRHGRGSHRRGLPPDRRPRGREPPPCADNRS
jgi:isochorismate hydrolase